MLNEQANLAQMVPKWTRFFFFQDSLEVWVWQVPRYQLGGNGGGSFWCHRSEGTVGTSFPGCEFLPVFVHKSSLRDSSPCKCSFFIPLSGSSRILLSLLHLCDFFAASVALLLKQHDRELLKRARWGDVTKVCRQRQTAELSIICPQIGPLNWKKVIWKGERIIKTHVLWLIQMDIKYDKILFYMRRNWNILLQTYLIVV